MSSLELYWKGFIFTSANRSLEKNKYLFKDDAYKYIILLYYHTKVQYQYIDNPTYPGNIRSEDEECKF